MSVIDANRFVLEQAAHGHRSMLLSQALKLACKLLSVLVLSRLVSPGDHGLFAMASSVVLLLALFRDAGLGAAAVQARALDVVQMNTLFWCHLAIGVALAVVTLGSAPLAALFYTSPAVTPLLLTMSGAFLLIGAGGFVRSQLERASRFKEVSRNESAGAVIATISMIGAAAAGAGAYSFVVYLLVFEAVVTGLAWRALNWRPQAMLRLGSIRSLFRTGADLTGYQVIVHLAQQIDAIMVGRFFGAHALGLYNRSNQLLSLPQLNVAAPLNQVALVTLARLGSGSSDFIRHARDTATVVAHLVLPLFAVCAVMPDETVRMILGPQWPDAAPLLRMLAIAAAATTITSLGYAINVAAGQTRRLVLSAAVALPVTIAAVWLGAQRGPIGVAENIAAANGVLVLPRLWWTLRGLPEGLRGYLHALVGPFVVTAIFSVGLWAGQLGAEGFHWAVRLGAAGLGGTIAVISLAAPWPRLRAEARMVAGYLPLPWPRTN